MTANMDKYVVLRRRFAGPDGAYGMIFGYLDAGSGSLILQAVLGGLAGIAVFFKAWRARITGKKAVDEAMAESEGLTDEPTVPADS